MDVCLRALVKTCPDRSKSRSLDAGVSARHRRPKGFSTNCRNRAAAFKRAPCGNCIV